MFCEAQKCYLAFDSRLSFSISKICNSVSTLLNVVKIDVVERCRFQYWRKQRHFKVDLTMCDVATSYQVKNNIESTLNCFLESVIHYMLYHVMYAFQSESTLYSCLNIKELLAENTCSIWRLSELIFRLTCSVASS